MAREDEIDKLTQSLKVFTTKDLAEIVLHLGWRGTMASSLTWCNTLLKSLVQVNKVVKSSGYWCVPAYRGQYLGHDRGITRAIVQFLKSGHGIRAWRETSFGSLRADLIVLIEREGGDGRLAVYEEVVSERPEYLAMKIGEWRRWPGALDALSRLTGYSIPAFDLVADGQFGTWRLADFLEEIKCTS